MWAPRPHSNKRLLEFVRHDEYGTIFAQGARHQIQVTRYFFPQEYNHKAYLFNSIYDTPSGSAVCFIYTRMHIMDADESDDAMRRMRVTVLNK